MGKCSRIRQGLDADAINVIISEASDLQLCKIFPDEHCITITMWKWLLLSSHFNTLDCDIVISYLKCYEEKEYINGLVYINYDEIANNVNGNFISIGNEQ